MSDNPTGWGASMRLDEVYRASPLRGFWEARPPALLTCLAFVVLQKKRQDVAEPLKRFRTRYDSHGPADPLFGSLPSRTC